MGTHIELVPKAELSIVTRNSSKAWIPELIAAAGPEVTETYIDFFTSTIRNRNTRAAYARACWQFFEWCAAHGLVHRLISGRHTAVGDLADFQGASDEHTLIRREERATRKIGQSAIGPPGWLEKGPSASLLVRCVSQRIRSSLMPSIQTLLKPTVCLPFMRRCTRAHDRATVPCGCLN
jgi:hypothetical protein